MEDKIENKEKYNGLAIAVAIAVVILFFGGLYFIVGDSL